MKMTTRGRVTIPKQIREAMGLKGGSKVDFEYTGGEEAIVVRKAPVAQSKAGCRPRRQTTTRTKSG
jgi:AbrB family looped-hinge helix DNA binding protein